MEAQSGFIGLFILLPAIFLAGMMFDRGSGFIATGVAVTGVLWLLRPQWSSALALPLVLFVFIALAFAVVAETLRKEMEIAVASERSKTLLLQEVAHRTKNNLAMLSAMVRLQSRTLGQDASAALEKTSQRIQTMAEVYDHLMLRDQTKIVDLKEYIGDIVRRLMALSGVPGSNGSAAPIRPASIRRATTISTHTMRATRTEGAATTPSDRSP
jgi:signal transduction histidine kinase